MQKIDSASGGSDGSTSINQQRKLLGLMEGSRSFCQRHYVIRVVRHLLHQRLVLLRRENLLVGLSDDCFGRELQYEWNWGKGNKLSIMSCWIPSWQTHVNFVLGLQRALCRINSSNRSSVKGCKAVEHCKATILGGQRAFHAYLDLGLSELLFRRASLWTPTHSRQGGGHKERSRPSLSRGTAWPLAWDLLQICFF